METLNVPDSTIMATRHLRSNKPASQSESPPRQHFNPEAADGNISAPAHENTIQSGAQLIRGARVCDPQRFLQGGRPAIGRRLAQAHSATPLTATLDRARLKCGACSTGSTRLSWLTITHAQRRSSVRSGDTNTGETNPRRRWGVARGLTPIVRAIADARRWCHSRS